MSSVSSVSCLSGVDSDGKRGRDEIHQTARLVNVQGHGGKFIRQRGRTGDDLLKQRQHIALQRFDLRAVDGGAGFRNRRNVGAHERRQLRELAETHPFQTFGKHKQALVGHLDDFMHHGGSTDRIKVAGLGVVDARLALRHNDNGLILSERIDKLDGTFPPHSEGQDGVRKQNGIPHRKHGQGPYVIYFLMLSNRLGKRLLGHWLSLSVTHSSLDDIPLGKVSSSLFGLELLDSIGIPSCPA